MSARPVLYHYCCDHSEPGIRRDGVIRPGMPWYRYDARLAANDEPMSGLWRAPAVCWLTDMPEPDATALGLTSYSIPCDRTEFRFTVARGTDVMPWLQFATTHGANPGWLAVLHVGRQPDRWFVGICPQPVTDCLDRRARRRTA